MAQAFSAWTKLTWDDLDQWAGSRSVARGKAYQQQGRVRQLAAASDDDGSVIATVIGTEPYLTLVTLDAKKRRAGRLASVCSCPVGSHCKHAVATVIELLQQLENGAAIPELLPDDLRLKLLAGETEGFDESISDLLRDGPAAGSGRVTDEELRSFLESQTKAQLAALLMALCTEEPQVRTALAGRIQVQTGRTDDLLKAVHREMRKVTAAEAFDGGWGNEDALPDYGGLEKRLQMLLDVGCADEVVKLSEELVERINNQISQGNGEDDWSQAISKCFAVVADAFAASTLPEPEKLLRAIRLVRKDEYGVCDALDALLSQDWPEEVWSSAADDLWVELAALPVVEKSFAAYRAQYQRKQLSDWLIRALDLAGRSEEALEVCVAEASRGGEYVRAVERLLAEKQFDAADSLAREGLTKIDPTYRGIVIDLQNRIAEIAIERKDWQVPAAIAAQRFFERPSAEAYFELLRVAKKAKYEEQVAKAAVAFLETGKRPDIGRDGAAKAWPLPPPPEPPQGAGYPRPRPSAGPHYEVLIDLGIAQQRPEEVLKWYDLRRTAQAEWMRGIRVDRRDVRIAQAVQHSHPERAIEIYLQLAHALAAQTNVKTYPEVGTYLKHAKPLLTTAKTNRTWESTLAEFRTQYGRKPRLMEVIDRLEGQPIVATRISKSKRQ